MILSYRERRILSAIAKELSADATLRAVADLFAHPPTHRHAGRRNGRPAPSSTTTLISALTRRPSVFVIGSVLALICCVLLASLHFPVIITCVVLAVSGGLSVAVAIARHRTSAVRSDVTAAPAPHGGTS